MNIKVVYGIMVVSMLLAWSPSYAWYKQVAGPSYYSVGRASGLLSGILRSSFMRRAEPVPSESDESTADALASQPSRQNVIVKSMPVCIKEVTPNLKTCELYENVKGTFMCKAEVFISLGSSDCED